MVIKYRVHEVAKDFKTTSKAVTNILTEYATTPKNVQQALSDDELNLVFEHITQNNQIDDIAIVFAETYHEPEPVAVEEPAVADAVAERDDSGAAQTAEAKTNIPKQPKQPRKETVKFEPAKPTVGSSEIITDAAPADNRKSGTRTVDTRSGAVNLDRYDERIDKFVTKDMENQKGGMQKIARKGDRRPAVISQKKRQEDRDRMRRLQLEALKKQPITVKIGEEISVGELASRMKKTGVEVVKQLMKLGVMASVSQIIDHDTAAMVAIEMGAKVEREIVVTIEEKLIDDSVDVDENLEARDPVVVVMGHVDHGKTSLLDSIRKADVAEGEAGGITQHIGAYRVTVGDHKITFLDTPGHAAFTSMRARGAKVTDVAILVVAADDGIMPQTIEAINHAKAAEVPIIVAINKMDKPEANPDRIKQQLTEHGLVSEDWGGETIICPVSAKKGDGIPHLLDMVLLTAEVQQLRANPNRLAKGTVIEARLDKGRGTVATLLVQNGTLKQGDLILAGTSVGNVRAMTNENGQPLKEAGPSVPVEITGLSEVPGAGDPFFAVTDERMARELVDQRKDAERDERNRSATAVSFDNLFDQIKEGQLKELRLLIKADVQGSAEALKASLEKLSNDEVRIKIIHTGVGAISESDILLSATSNAILIGFNVRPDPSARDSAARNNVDIRLYRVIYECIEEMEAAMKGLLDPKFVEVVLGRVEVRQVFKVTGVGTVAGCYVTDGKIVRNASVRLLRDGVVIHEGILESLKRFKDDVREVATGYECGMNIEKYNDLKEGDVIEAYEMQQVE
ncbi:MAG: translation initiation factor IF-2 [Oscillospiraceae bacterium]|nr:translation initiation factor IF-2 [Oscillospiraceae bacterium]